MDLTRLVKLVRTMTVGLAAMVLVGATTAALLDHGGDVVSAATVRSASCHAFDFRPSDQKTRYGIKDLGLYTDQSSQGDDYYMCDPQLPDGATVTKVQFTMQDISGGGGLTYCGLFRSPLTATAAGTYQELAQLTPTGMVAQPGRIRRADTSIKNATIDLATYAYWLQCHIDYVFSPSSLTDVVLYGATVTYRGG